MLSDIRVISSRNTLCACVSLWIWTNLRSDNRSNCKCISVTVLTCPWCHTITRLFCGNKAKQKLHIRTIQIYETENSIGPYRFLAERAELLAEKTRLIRYLLYGQHFSNLKGALSKLYCPKTQCTRARLRVNVYKEFIVTDHNFHQFEKGEWKTLVQAEIEARKYVLSQQRRSPSNERQTELTSPELNTWS